VVPRSPDELAILDSLMCQRVENILVFVNVALWFIVTAFVVGTMRRRSSFFAASSSVWLPIAVV